MQSQQKSQLPRPISRILFRCSQQTQVDVRSKIPIQEGAVLSGELLQKTREAARAVDQRLEIRVDQAPPPLSPEQLLKIPEEIRRKITPPACEDGVNVTIYDPASLPQRIRMDAGIQESMLEQRATPVVAGSDKGEVQLAVIVGKDGSVIDAKPLSGEASLVDAALDAVRQWKYRPLLLNGFPVEVQTTVEVRFE
jgi:TonB family protein